MKRKIATAVAWAIAAGACGVAIVQAQTTPPSYVLARINVKDENTKTTFFLRRKPTSKRLLLAFRTDTNRLHFPRTD